MMAQDQSATERNAERTIRTVIEIGEAREHFTRDMDATKAQQWSDQLIDCGYVIEQSNAFRTVFLNQTTRRRAWLNSCALYRADMPFVV